LIVISLPTVLVTADSLKMNIRPFNPSDLEALIELWQQTGLATPQNDSQKDIERKMKVDPELLLVAVKGSELVGSVMGGYEGHRGWINYLAVSPKHQRQGIATLLMRKIEADLLSRGCPKINLQVRDTNTKVLAFYVALGYLDDKVVGFGKRLIHDQ